MPISQSLRFGFSSVLSALLAAACFVDPSSAFADFSTPSGPAPQKGFSNGLDASTGAAGAGAAAGAAAAPDLYLEYNNYGAHVRTSYVPGFVPKTSSLFENPRTFPAKPGPFADPYTTLGVPGWFYCSPNGYQSSVPPDSQAYNYVAGKLGITSSLQHGFPRGMRVVERVVIPYAPYMERSGLYISTSPSAGYVTTPQVLSPLQQQQTVTTTEEKTVTRVKGADGATAPLPARAAIPDEVSDK